MEEHDQGHRSGVDSSVRGWTGCADCWHADYAHHSITLICDFPDCTCQQFKPVEP